MPSLEFPPGSGKSKKKEEKPMPANFETLESTEPQPIVMVNTIVSRIAEGKPPRKARKSVSMGGEVYRAKEFDSIDGAPKNEAPVVAKESAEPLDLNSRSEFETHLKKTVRSINEIEADIKAKEEELRAHEADAERELRSTGIRETARFQAHNGGEAVETAEERYVRTEAELKQLAKEKAEATRQMPVAANDNFPSASENSPTAPVHEKMPEAPAVAASASSEPPIESLTRPASRAVREAARRNNSFRSLMTGAFAALGIASASSAAGEKADSRVPAAAARVAEATMPSVTLDRGEGADKAFGYLQRQMIHQFHTSDKAPNEVIKLLMDTSPNALSRTLHFAEGKKSTMSLKPGDSFSVSPKGELVYRSGATEKILLNAEGKAPGTFSWGHMRLTVPFLHARAPRVQLAAMREPSVTADQKLVYAEELKKDAQGHPGLAPNTDADIKSFLAKARAEHAAPTAPAAAETAPVQAAPPAPAPHSEAPQPPAEVAPAPAPAPQPTPKAEATPPPPAPAPKAEAVPAAPAPAPEAAPATPRGEVYINPHGVEVHRDVTEAYQIKQGNQNLIVFWGTNDDKMLDTARTFIRKARERHIETEVFAEVTLPNPMTGERQTGIFRFGTDGEERAYPPGQPAPIQPFGPDDFVKMDEKTAQQLHGILFEH